MPDPDARGLEGPDLDVRRFHEPDDVTAPDPDRAVPDAAAPAAPAAVETTSRWLVSFESPPRGALRTSGVRDRVEVLRGMGVGPVATSSDAPGAALPPDAGALLLERLGVAIVREPPAPSQREHALVRTVERERVVRTPAPVPGPAGASDDPDADDPDADDPDADDPDADDPHTDDPGADHLAEPFDPDLSWALASLGRGSGRRGRGIGVAVLDTGIDPDHPDLGALVATTSLVPGEDARDGNGHGTHCAGVVCGRGTGPRYGVAVEAALYVGKVLSDTGAGGLGDVLAGIDWAAEQGCRVVSMSLGSPADDGEPSAIFEQVAAELLAEPRSVHLVAAAGNDSRRSAGLVAPVGVPASAPAVLAVAAVDAGLRVADFSNGGSEVAIAAPGVEVLSAWPGGGRQVLSGTSMATPHVAGVLALLLESEPGLTGPQVVDRLRRLARRLPLPAPDVGAGLVQRP